MKLLLKKVGSLEVDVNRCLLYVGDIANQAALLIQKNIKKIFAVWKYREIKEETRRRRETIKLNKIIKVQSLVRRFLSKKYIQKIKDENIIKEKLDRIRKRLLVLKLKDFWHKKKYVFETIRRKYAEVSDSSSKPVSEAVFSTIFHSANDKTKTISEISSRKSSVNEIKKEITFSKEIASFKEITSYKGITSSKEITFSKENLMIIPIVKPPKAPKQITLNYLTPTENYKNRTTTNETEVTKSPTTYKIRSIGRQRFQRNTHSRMNYITQVQHETDKKRAASADYKKHKQTISRTKMLTPISMNELIETFKEPEIVKNPPPNPLIRKLEDLPNQLTEETVERLYIYNAPKNQSISFKDALRRFFFLFVL